VRLAAAVVLALALAGCGGAREHGRATLWVTRDRGDRVLFTGTVPAGLTAMQALERVQTVKTRYGGRFVQAIGGIQGDASKQRDWFYFVNGVEADRGAAEVRLHGGDVEWWDYRSWRHAVSVPVVVGAWPEPVAGHVSVVAGSPAAGSAARELARSLHATPGGRDRVVVTAKPVTFHGVKRGGAIWFLIDAQDAVRLARNPRLARFHYEGLGCAPFLPRPC